MLDFGDKGVYIYKYIVILKNCESYIRCCNRKLVIFFMYIIVLVVVIRIFMIDGFNSVYLCNL